MASQLAPIEVFCSYAHKDEMWLRELEKHLSLLKKQGLIMTWHDRILLPGTNWAHSIDSRLNSASLILLLISADFLASDYCYGVEMRRALQRHEAQEAHVLPILLRPVEWKGAPFEHLQGLPTNAKPITSWKNKDEAFSHVVQGIRNVIYELNAIKGNKHSNKTSDPSEGRTMIPVPKPPYISPDSVFLFNQALPDPDELYGRARECQTLMNRIRNKAATSIVGPRRIGKTWLMNYLKFVTHRELGTRFILGYLHATAVQCATVAGFTASAMEALGVQKRLFNDTDYPLIFLQQAVQAFKAEQKVPVLCIDEFEGFGNRPVFDLHFFTALRAIAEEGLCLIIVSKIPLIDVVSNYTQTSPFFNIFEQLNLGPFKVKDAEDFIHSKGHKAGLTKQERQYLLHYGQKDGAYWPIRLQLVGKMLLEDKILAWQKRDQDYYRPEDPHYWQEFETRLEEKWGAVSR